MGPDLPIKSPRTHLKYLVESEVGVGEQRKNPRELQLGQRGL